MTLRDDFLKHQIALQRLAVTEANNIKKYLKALNERAKSLASAGVPDYLIKTSLKQSIDGLVSNSIDNMTKVAIYENKFSVNTMNKYLSDAVDRSTEQELKNLLLTTSVPVNSRDGTNNMKLATAYNRFSNSKVNEVNQILLDSKLEGLDAEELSARLDERLNGLQTSQALALSVLAVNFTANVARNAADIPMVWVTALDENVCDYCDPNHGELIDDVGFPPGHWGCRCHTEPANED